jgi:hypothetical protein
MAFTDSEQEREDALGMIAASVDTVAEEVCKRHYAAPTQEHQLSAKLAEAIEKLAPQEHPVFDERKLDLFRGFRIISARYPAAGMSAAVGYLSPVVYAKPALPECNGTGRCALHRELRASSRCITKPTELKSALSPQNWIVYG